MPDINLSWTVHTTQVAGVTFSDSDSAPVTKFFNPGPHPGPAIFEIWESDSCSDSGYNHRFNRNLPMFLLKKWRHRLLLLPKLKRDSSSGSGLSQIFYFCPGSGSERKTQNAAGVDSGTPDPVPPLSHQTPPSIKDERTVKFFSSSPVLIRWNWFRSSPDLQNFWKSSVRSGPDPPM